MSDAARSLGILILVAIQAVGLQAQLAESVAEAPAELVVFPEALRIDSRDDRPLPVVSARFADGRTEDVGAAALLSIDPPTLAGLDAQGRLVGAADGEGRLIVSFRGRMAEVPLTVRAIATSPRPDFRHDVIPVLTRVGCNAGGCHGAAQGKNGFRLSLFGYDPDADHFRLTREMRGRRLDVGDPAASLMLRKPTMQVPHKGGLRLEKDSDGYRTIVDWIADGAPPADGKRAPLDGIAIGPRDVALTQSGAPQRLRVVARHADGSDRDVTELALLSSSDAAVVGIAADGLLTPGIAGESVIMARFAAFAEAVTVMVLPADPEPLGPIVTVTNDIDRLIFARQRTLRVQRAEVCDDATFIRRVKLDLLNLLPTVDEARAFIADVDPAKREKLVDAWLERPELDDVLALSWADVLGVAPDPDVSDKVARGVVEWLRAQFRARRPFDDMVRDLLTASGSAFENPPAGFWVEHRDAKTAAENVAQIFLGVRIQCAQCHNHPFERWTLDDYYANAALFAQTAIKRTEDPRDRVVFPRGGGEVPHPVDRRARAPKPLGGVEMTIAAGSDRRVALTNWLLAPENPGMARNVANRLFARFFGRGLVEPVDDVRASNPPSHPELLDALAASLIATRYDLRAFIRKLVLSESYQLAAVPGGRGAFASAGVRRLGAEQLADAIAQVAEVTIEINGLPRGARATEMSAVREPGYFMEVFGRPRREGVCACDRRDEPGLGQALHLMNGDTVVRAVASPRGRVARLVAAGLSDEVIVDELWLAAFARPPTTGERELAVATIGKAADRRHAVEDLTWSLLNAKEFLFNH